MHLKQRTIWQLLLSCIMVFTLVAPFGTDLGLAAPAADTAALVGSLQSELGCAGDWDPACAATELDFDAEDNVFQHTFNVPAGNYEYKVALNDGWTENYGRYATPGGDNLPLNLGDAAVKFYFDPTSHWIVDNFNYTIATIPGSFQSELGCAGDWDPSCLRSWLQDVNEDGIFTFVTTALTAGTYEGKVAIDESWAENYGKDGVPGGDNYAFTVPVNNAVVVFTYDGTTHVLTIDIGPASVTIAGSLQTELGCAGDWDPSCSATFLGYNLEDDVWQQDFKVPAGNWEYKAALNGSWDENYGQHAVPGGDNIPLALGAETDVKFYYDHKSHWITDNQNSRIVTAPGSYQSKLGCAGDWDPSCLRSWLQDVDGDGIYIMETRAIPAGNYEAKATINESWVENYGQNGVPGGANIPFNVPSNGATVFFRFDSATNILTISAGHNLDNNVEYFGLGHMSQDTLYRHPFGAVNPGTEITLRFRTYHNDVEKVRARFWNTATSSESYKNLVKVAEDVSCYDENQPDESCDFWETTYTPAQIGTLYYRFIAIDGTATAYYADDSFMDGGWGNTTPTMIDNSYAITVYDPSFTVLPWMQNAVIYQIFPDRFRNARRSNDADTTEPRYSYPDNPDDQIITKEWDDLPEGYCRNYVDETCLEGPRGRDYFGGDIAGIRQKIRYLKALGVTVIYLNPVFEAGSNHSYDTQDYYQIDHFFGTNGEFIALARLAHFNGMKVILDGVFNHVASDSPYFDRYGHYTEVGACESVDSPYRDWFTFHEGAAGSGPCAGANGPDSATYDSWFGFDSLPVLNKANAEVRGMIYESENAVARYWLNMGADGWRLDVMPDASFPAGFWQEFRAVVQETKSDAVILGELWKKGDVLPFAHGDTADSTMNYRFRNAILGFFGTVDNKGFNDDGQSNQPPSLFARKMISQREDYPDATYYALMNLMDSHDTKRILWSLTPGANNRQEKEFNAANLEAGKQLLKLATIVQMTVPGAPTIYYGDEVGVTGDDDPDDRRTFPWNDQAAGPFWAFFSINDPYQGAGGDHDLLDHYRMVTQLRADNPVFREGALSFLYTNDDDRTMAYLMRTSDAAAIVAVNRSDSPKTLSFHLNGVLPHDVMLSDALGGIGDVMAAGHDLSFELPGLSAAVLLPEPGQDLVAPAAPTNLVAVAGNAVVDLSWDAVADATGYHVLRSPLPYGGYEEVGMTEANSFSDTSVTNGQRYFYVVFAHDAAMNHGPNSNEADALPAFPIGWAAIVWPASITHELSVNRTENVYAQVWIAGLTDSGGDPDSVWAELGFGPVGSDPASWSTWEPMAHNAACGSCGNNYEYMGSMRPEAVGSYDYLARFSTNLGEGWTYAYWINDGTPGDLTVTPNPDTTPPAAPANLRVVDWGAGFIDLAWDAEAEAAEYWLYRGLSSGAYGDPLVKLPASETGYVDLDVEPGTTYFYVVKAVDAALNKSPNSNEVFQAAEPKVVNVTFRVLVPDETPGAENVCITGDTQPLEWNPGKTPMTKVGTDLWEITIQYPDGLPIQYKFVRCGSWEKVEWWGTITSVANRNTTVVYGTDGNQLVDNTATDWGNGEDVTKAVQFWRDPLVETTTPADGASGAAPANVTVVFSRIIKEPDSGNFNDSIKVELGGNPVAGTVSAPDDVTLVWTPSAALAAGTYTVTVFNVKSDQPGDSVSMQAPYVFTFTVTP